MKSSSPHRRFWEINGNSVNVTCGYPVFPMTDVSLCHTRDKNWRRGSELNRRIEVLQTSALPLGYRALTPFDLSVM